VTGKKRIVRPKAPTAKTAVPSLDLTRRDGHPSWRFEDADKGGPYSFAKLDPKELTEVLDGLVHFEGHKVAKTIGDGSKGTHHPCELHTLSAAARARLQAIKHDDHDRVWGFRLMAHQKERVWALRYGDVFHLLWWDPNHEVAPTARQRR
jgi:hypothetical protein